MAKIKLAKKNTLSPDEFEAKYAKERISIWLDEDLLDEIRKIAKENDKKYQTLINEILRTYAFSNKSKYISKIINKMNQAIDDLKKMQID